MRKFLIWFIAILCVVALTLPLWISKVYSSPSKPGVSVTAPVTPGGTSTTSPSETYSTLRLGATGDLTETLQTRLNAWNVQPSLTVDGQFGPDTMMNVAAFQEANGLSVDGTVGPATWAALLKTPPANPAAIEISGGDPSSVASVLNAGSETTSSSGYFQTTSSILVDTANGVYDQMYYQLGQELVSDGLGNTIINLGREMNGAWYQWSERNAPKSEQDAYILAWRQVVLSMRSVPGNNFTFVWTLSPGDTNVSEAWPGSAFVDYVGTDLFDWYGGYPNISHVQHWQNYLTATGPGNLFWMAQLSQATGKQIMFPEWGLDFHSFGGGDDAYFIQQMESWMKAHNAIGLYWEQSHVGSASNPTGPLLANEGASAQVNSVGAVNAFGALLGGHVQYAGVYLDDHTWPTAANSQSTLVPWENTGYQLVLSIPMGPLPTSTPSYAGPPEPTHVVTTGGKTTTTTNYQLADYQDALDALRQG